MLTMSTAALRFVYTYTSPRPHIAEGLAHMPVTWTSTYVCNKCGAQRQWYRQSPSMPDGWLMLGEDMYCEKHELNLTLDGVVVERKERVHVDKPPAWETD